MSIIAFCCSSKTIKDQQEVFCTPLDPSFNRLLKVVELVLTVCRTLATLQTFCDRRTEEGGWMAEMGRERRGLTRLEGP